MERDESLSPERKVSDVSANYDTERYFIFTFESLPVLWDQQHTFYSSKYKRLEALKQLLTIYKRIKPDATVNDVRRKINSLRSNYRRELRKIEASQKIAANESEVYKPTLWNYQYLDFLRTGEHPNILLHKAKIKIKTEDTESEPEDNPNSSNMKTEETTTDNNTKNVIPNASVLMAQPAKTAQRILIKKLLKKQSEKKLSLQSSTLASIWVEKLQKLDPVQKLFAEKAINDILFEAQLGNLNKNSVKINVPPAEGLSFGVSSPSTSSSHCTPKPDVLRQARWY